MALNESYNWDNVFLRDLTVCVLATLENKVKWTNVFESGPRDVNCKIYYSLTGSEDFLMDSFVDDIASNERFVELNTDTYPRGHITLTGWNIRSDEFANPNVWLRTVVENQDEIKNILAKVRAIPISAQYEFTLLVNSEIDTFKASQSIMNTLWMYKYMYFEHNFMNIDAVLTVPEDQQVDIQREHNLSSDEEIKLTISFEVRTYYPAYNDSEGSKTVIDQPKGMNWMNQLKVFNQGSAKTSNFDMNIKPRKIKFPDDNKLKIYVDLVKPSSLSLKVYDSMARVLQEEEFNDRYESGEHVIIVDISDKTKWGTGIYYAKVENDDSENTQKFIIDN